MATSAADASTLPAVHPSDEIQPAETRGPSRTPASTPVGVTAAQGTTAKSHVRDLESTGAQVHANPVYDREAKVPGLPAPKETLQEAQITPEKAATPTAALAPATPEKSEPVAAPLLVASPTKPEAEIEAEGPADPAARAVHEAEPEKVPGGGCFACFAASKKNKKEKEAKVGATEEAKEGPVEGAKAAEGAGTAAAVGAVPAALAGGAVAAAATGGPDDDKSKEAAAESLTLPALPKEEVEQLEKDRLAKEVTVPAEVNLPAEVPAGDGTAADVSSLAQLKKETAKLAEETEETAELSEEKAAEKGVETSGPVADATAVEYETPAAVAAGTASAAPEEQAVELDAQEVPPASGELTPLTEMQSKHDAVEDTVDAPSGKGYTSQKALEEQAPLPGTLDRQSAASGDDNLPAAAAGGVLAAAATAAAASRSSETTSVVTSTQPAELPASTTPAATTATGTTASGAVAPGGAATAAGAGGMAAGEAAAIAAGAVGGAALVGGAAGVVASKAGKTPEEKKAAKEAKKKKKEEKAAKKAKAKEEEKAAKAKAKEEQERKKAKAKEEKEREKAKAQAKEEKPAAASAAKGEDGKALEGAEGELGAEEAAVRPKRRGFFACFGSAQPAVVEQQEHEGEVVGAAAAGGLAGAAVAGAAVAGAESPEGKAKGDVLAPGTPTQAEGELPATPADSPAKPVKPSKVDYSAIHMAKTPSVALRKGYNPRTGLYDTEAAKPKPRLFSPMRAGQPQLQSSVAQAAKATSQRRLVAQESTKQHKVSSSWRVVTDAPVGQGIDRPEVGKNLRPLSTSLA